QNLANYCRVAAEAPLPEPVAQHRDRVRAGAPVVFVVEDAAERRPDAEAGEVIARDQFAPEQLRLRARPGHTQRHAVMSDQIAEGFVPVAVIQVVGVREGVGEWRTLFGDVERRELLR